MSKKSLFAKVGFVVASTLVLSGCFYGYSLTTPASCPVEPFGGGQAVEVPLDVQLSDNSPAGAQELGIEVVARGFDASGLDVQAAVIVEHASGFYRPGGFASLFAGQTPSPTPSESNNPGTLDSFYAGWNPEFLGVPLATYDGLSNNYESPEPQDDAAVFRALSTDDVNRTRPDVTAAWWDASSLGEKIALTNEELSISSNEQNRLVMPGIISVRCANDASGTIRAAQAIYPNYIDGTTPLVFAASDDVNRELTGTLTLPDEVPFIDGYMQAILYADQPNLFAGDMPDSISSLWLKLLALNTEMGGYGSQGSPFMLLGDQTNVFGSPAAFVDRQVSYKIGTFDNDVSGTVYRDSRPPAGEYWMFTAFLPTGFDSDFVDPDLVRSAFFKVTISESGSSITSAAVVGLPLDFEPAVERAAVTSSVSPSITSVLPAEVSVAGGTKVTVTGTHLSGASVLVGNAPAALVSNTDGSIEFTAPPSPAGKLGKVDVKLTTSAGIITVQDGVTYVKAPAAAVIRPLVRNVSGFAGGSATLPSSQKTAISRIAKEASAFNSATCVGYSGGGIKTATDRALALGRAKAVCAKVKAANPAISVRVTVNAQNLGFEPSARKVEITLSR